ncbi:MAG: hypothetical protein K9L28_03675 [Synergistales bacterium]|nr:hypothetical protein [Synergistales bacterium]
MEDRYEHDCLGMWGDGENSTGHLWFDLYPAEDGTFPGDEGQPLLVTCEAFGWEDKEISNDYNATYARYYRYRFNERPDFLGKKMEFRITLEDDKTYTWERTIDLTDVEASPDVEWSYKQNGGWINIVEDDCSNDVWMSLPNSEDLHLDYQVSGDLDDGWAARGWTYASGVNFLSTYGEPVETSVRTGKGDNSDPLREEFILNTSFANYVFRYATVRKNFGDNAQFEWVFNRTGRTDKIGDNENPDNNWAVENLLVTEQWNLISPDEGISYDLEAEGLDSRGKGSKRLIVSGLDDMTLSRDCEVQEDGDWYGYWELPGRPGVNAQNQAVVTTWRTAGTAVSYDVEINLTSEDQSRSKDYTFMIPEGSETAGTDDVAVEVYYRSDHITDPGNEEDPTDSGWTELATLHAGDRMPDIPVNATTLLLATVGLPEQWWRVYEEGYVSQNVSRGGGDYRVLENGEWKSLEEDEKVCPVRRTRREFERTEFVMCLDRLTDLHKKWKKIMYVSMVRGGMQCYQFQFLFEITRP